MDTSCGVLGVCSSVSSVSTYLVMFGDSCWQACADGYEALVVTGLRRLRYLRSP